MDVMKIAEELRAFVDREVLHGQGADLNPSTPLLEWGILDSLSMQSLLLFIEERFAVCIPDEEVVPENFATLRAVAELVARQPPGRQGPDTAAPVPVTANQLAAWGVEPRTASLGGGLSVHSLWTHGRGPTWVLLPALGNSAATWGPFMRALVDEQRAVAFDWLGFGLSSSDKAAPDLLDQVDALERALDAGVETPVVLIGNSAGAIAAVELARRRPERVAALVCMGYGRVEDSREWWKRLLDIARTPESFFEHTLFRQQGSTAAAKAALSHMLAQPAFAGFMSARAHAALAAPLNDVKLPALFILGEEDRLVRPGELMRAARELKGASVQRLARCGHLVPIEQPQESLLLVHSFLREVLR